MARFKSARVRFLYSSFTDGVPIVKDYPRDGLRQLILNVAATCNMRCSYCFAAQGTYANNARPFMTATKAIRYVDDLLKVLGHIEQIKFFGGEPLLNVECIEAVCLHITGRWERGELEHLPHFHINTNLTVAVDDLVRLVKAYGMTVTVGIDGPAAVHDALRHFPDGKGSFSVVDENIRRLIDLCDQPRSLEVVYTTEHKRRHLRPVSVHQYLTERYGPRNIIIHPEVPVLDFGKRQCSRPRRDRLSNRAVRKYFSEYGRYLAEEALRSQRPLCQHTLMADLCAPTYADHYCDAAIGDLAISTDGDIYPCAGLCGNRAFCMGHAGEGALDISRISETRQRFADNQKSTSPLCASCDVVKTCSSCPAAMLSENDALNVPVRSICAYRIGMTEGRLLAMVDAQRRHRGNHLARGIFSLWRSAIMP